MRIAILGAGPAGLYLAYLVKRRRPDIDVTVIEQNPADATFGFGVVFSDQALEFLHEDDEETYAAIVPHMESWSDIVIVHRGERVVIDGPCLSACTLVLDMVPSNRICVTRRAILGFHAARSVDREGRMYAEPEASALVLEAYPAAVRGWIRRRGGLGSRLLLLRGRELAAIYPRCH